MYILKITAEKNSYENVNNKIKRSPVGKLVLDSISHAFKQVL